MCGVCACACACERDDSGVIWNGMSDVELFGKMVGVLVQDGSVVVGKIDNAPRGGRRGGGGIIGIIGIIGQALGTGRCREFGIVREATDHLITPHRMISQNCLSIAILLA